MSLANSTVFRATMEAAEIIAEQYEFVRVFNSNLCAYIEAGREGYGLTVYIDCAAMRCDISSYELDEMVRAKTTKRLLRKGSLADMKAALFEHLKEAA